MFTEFELVPSACMRAYFEELHFEFTDFQKAALIWNALGKTWKERLEALNELAEITEDHNVRRQIHERTAFEQKKWETFLNNESGRYIYVVEDWEDGESCGYFASYDMAFKYAKRYVEEYKNVCIIKKQLVVQGEEDEMVRSSGKLNPYMGMEDIQPEFISYEGDPVSETALNQNGEITRIDSNELMKEEEDVVDSFRPDRFEHAFIKIPFDMQVGTPVKDLTTGQYYVLTQGKREWDTYLQRIESNGWYVDYSDIQVVVYRLTKNGYWSHEHINPLYLDYDWPPYIQGDDMNNALRGAMEALSDYLRMKDCGKTERADGKMVLERSKEYAETVKKQAPWYKSVQYAKEAEDIFF